MDRVRVRAWVGTVVFLVVTPGVVAGLVPAVLTIILGQALLCASATSLLYACLVLVAVAVFVRAYEEPTLELEYGAEYQAYRRNVRGWIPRIRPWDEAAQP